MRRSREVADIIVGQFEQYRIDPLRDERAKHARICVLKTERPGERRERVTALGIGVLRK